MQEKEIRGKLFDLADETDTIKSDFESGEDDLEETLSRLWGLKILTSEAIRIIEEEGLARAK